jgi:hypothetical protein
MSTVPPQPLARIQNPKFFEGFVICAREREREIERERREWRRKECVGFGGEEASRWEGWVER